MTTVRQLLDEKGHDVWTVGPDDTVYEALKLMADRNLGGVLVVEDGEPVGIFTERDYARNVYLKGKSSPNTPISDVMVTNLVCADPDQTVEESMAVMTDRRIRHLPVIENGKLVGIVSIGDLVKAIIAKQQFMIEQLVHYIHG
jgi:CBS domain-containing protein